MAWVLRLLVAVMVASAALPAASAAESGWVWPVSGEILTSYRNGSDPYAGGQHRGVDIASAAGTPIVAAAGGSVRFAGVAGSSGLTVAIRTSDGRFDVSYLHLATADVRKGEVVATGQRIGAVGSSGRRSADAPHLHLGVRAAGSRHAYRDPLDLLPLPSPPTGEVPRGAPVPVGAPLRIAPEPRPTRGRVPAPVPRSPRVVRPVPVPTARRTPLAARDRRQPRGRSRAPSPSAAPAGSPAPVAQGAHASGRGVRAPEIGPAPAPVEAPSPSGRPAPALAPLRRGAATAGPDLGLAFACAGLLAAAVVGRPRRSPPDRARSGRLRAGRLLALLFVRRPSRTGLFHARAGAHANRGGPSRTRRLP